MPSGKKKKSVFAKDPSSVPSFHIGGSQLPITLALLTFLGFILTIYTCSPQKRKKYD